MKTSDHIGGLVKALSAAQGEFINPERNRTVKVRTKAGGDYTFDYATFDAILAMTRPILSRHGLAVIQGVQTATEKVDSSGHVMPKVVVTTRVAHESGEWIEDEIAGVAEGSDLQDIGSATTYLKRYSYTAMLGIAAEEDDDGGAGSGRATETVDRKPLPNCPKCNSNSHVIKGKEEYGGGYLCFEKKGGCGAKWHDEPAKDSKATNGKANADQNGKADAPPPDTSVYQKAVEAIMKANKAEDLDGIELLIGERYDQKAITGPQQAKLMNLCAQQRRAIKEQRAASEKENRRESAVA